MDRVFSQLTVTKAVDEGDHRILEGIASTPSADRMGDVVDPKGAQYSLPLPFLAQHNPNQPIGWVESAKVGKDGITVRVKIARDTGLQYVEDAWKQIKAGLVKGMSIGFRPLKYERIPESETYGVKFTAWEWLELSAVTIPANADASILAIKSAFAATVSGQRAAPPRLPAPSPAKPEGITTMKTIAQRIQEKEAELVTLRDTLTDALSRMDDSNPSEAVAAEIEDCNVKIKNAGTLLDSLRQSEASLALSAAKGAGTTVIQQNGGGNGGDVDAPHVIRQGLNRGKAASELDFLIKMAVCHLNARLTGQHPIQVMEARYGDDKELMRVAKGVPSLVTRTAVAGATTTNSTWAANLVETAIGQFIDLLTPFSTYPKLAALGTRIDFGTNGAIKLPYRNEGNELRGAFVAEGQPIPVRKASIGSLTLTPRKMGVISYFTKELAAASNPTIESLIRTWMARDTGIAMDIALLDAVAASTARPAGLQNGVTPVTSPGGGTSMTDVLADLQALIGAFTATQEGRKLALIMYPDEALFLSLLVNPAGNFMFPQMSREGGTLLGIPVIVSTSIAAKRIILIDAGAFVTATGDTPEFDVSEQATFHADDGGSAADQTAGNTVLPISTTGTPNTVAAPVVSLWQTAQIGIRMLLPLDWGIVRSGSVQAMDVAW